MLRPHPSRAVGGLASFALALGLLVAPRIAHAHPAVDDAQRLYEGAEFASALAALDRAEQADDLTRDELQRALELRLLLHLAMESPERLEADLTRLLTLAPDYRPGDEMPPEVHEALESVRPRVAAPLAVRASATEIGDTVRVDASVENDPADLTQGVRVGTRTGDGEPSIGASPASVSIPAGAALLYWAEAVGPGGVVIARDGSAEAPLRFESSAGLATEGGGDDALPWIITGVIVGALVVAGAIVLGVVLASEQGPSDRTQPTLPMVVGD